ncbi:hypothetical protein EH165_00195 [Nakamurella antarctica]|uniref:Uncharacterized protein n=1 Tax=Nakamurella antarctica TaxID=1902245 RepID=A0A3G8ZHR4_9ACTN|nr:hypothetical protein [Nakamurella antarctica]AZI56823.1 hypothetical protein EH165_00195 [Nakamurella antarctica]
MIDNDLAPDPESAQSNLLHARRVAARAQLVEVANRRLAPAFMPQQAVAIALVAVAALGLTAYAIFNDPKTVSVTSRLECWTSDSADSPILGVAPADGYVDPDGRTVDVSYNGYENAISTCGSLWAQGILTQAGIVPKPGRELIENGALVPKLLVCVDDAGAAAVIPTNDQTLCQAMGLAPAFPMP